MDIQCVTKEDDFLALGPIWNDFLRQTSNDILCLTHEWLRCWWHVFGNHSRLFVLLARDKGELAGIAPLRMVRGRWRGFPVRKLTFMANAISPRSDFLLKEGSEIALNDIIRYMSRCKEWDIAIFENIAEQSKSYTLIQQALRKANLPYTIENSIRSPFISIDSDWETYFSGRSKQFRKQLRNKVNRIYKLGDCSIQEVNTFDEWKRVSPEVFGVCENSWKSRKKPMASNEAKYAFLEELAEIASQDGWLSVWLLRVNGRAIAVEYDLIYNNGICALLGDFDEGYREYSPGSFLERHIIEHVFRSGYSEYDMLGSDVEYKMRWTDRARDHVTFTIFRRGIYSNLLSSVELGLLPLLRRSKSLVKLKNLIRKNL